MKKIIRSKFFKHASIYTFADILNKMVPFILLPILTRYLTPEEYGIIAMFLVAISIITIASTFDTHTAISVNYFKMTRENLKIFIANVLFLISITSIICLMIIIVFNSYLTEVFSLSIEWLLVAVLVAFTQFITTINLILWQSEQNPVPLSIYQISRTIVNLSLSLILIIEFSMGWEGRVYAIIVTAVLFGMLSFWLIYKRDYFNFRFDKVSIKDALRFGIPLLPHSIAIWSRRSIDRIIITTLISASATGLYVVGFQIASIITILTTSFNKAYSPYLYKNLQNISDNKKEKIVKYTYLYFAGTLLLAGMLSFLAPVIIKYFLDKDYSSSEEYIVWLAFGFAFSAMYQNIVNYIIYVKKTIYLSYITFSVSILHILLTYLLIKYNGAIGAAQAFTISSFITFIFVWILSIKVYPMPWFSIKKWV